MDQNTLSSLFIALLVTGYGFSQAGSKTINLPVRSNLGFEEGVWQIVIPSQAKTWRIFQYTPILPMKEWLLGAPNTQVLNRN